MSKQQITETDRDNLCDILWWLKGYKKGSNENLETSDFVQDHLDSLDKVVRYLREVLSPPTKKEDPTLKYRSEDGSMKGIPVCETVGNKLLREGIKLWVVRAPNDIILYSNLDSKYFDVEDRTGDIRIIPGNRIN